MNFMHVSLRWQRVHASLMSCEAVMEKTGMHFDDVKLIARSRNDASRSLIVLILELLKLIHIETRCTTPQEGLELEQSRRVPAAQRVRESCSKLGRK